MKSSLGQKFSRSTRSRTEIFRDFSDIFSSKKKFERFHGNAAFFYNRNDNGNLTIALGEIVHMNNTKCRPVILFFISSARGRSHSQHTRTVTRGDDLQKSRKYIETCATSASTFFGRGLGVGLKGNQVGYQVIPT